MQRPPVNRKSKRKGKIFLVTKWRLPASKLIGPPLVGNPGTWRRSHRAKRAKPLDTCLAAYRCVLWMDSNLE